jgi:hypothetical protein
MSVEQKVECIVHSVLFSNSILEAQTQYSFCDRDSRGAGILPAVRRTAAISTFNPNYITKKIMRSVQISHKEFLYLQLQILCGVVCFLLH